MLDWQTLCVMYLFVVAFVVNMSLLLSLTYGQSNNQLSPGWIMLSAICMIIMLVCFAIIVERSVGMHSPPAHSIKIHLI